jgi:hypothetical protein
MFSYRTICKIPGVEKKKSSKKNLSITKTTFFAIVILFPKSEEIVARDNILLNLGKK